ncbi:hypothetical protein RE6C_03933 [Rhodopirellula europaea 6C]|uniref:Uncharacterized protein n=1 Tax=Rhodopirellula europaea 6C TaxID=1263867 RepID=M2ARK7_9BACT|nr:hypothetical protein RE6C_03933 [Rhodopirellula europaea 6C]
MESLLSVPRDVRRSPTEASWMKRIDNATFIRCDLDSIAHQIGASHTD